MNNLNTNKDKIVFKRHTNFVMTLQDLIESYRHQTSLDKKDLYDLIFTKKFVKSEIKLKHRKEFLEKKLLNDDEYLDLFNSDFETLCKEWGGKKEDEKEKETENESESDTENESESDTENESETRSENESEEKNNPKNIEIVSISYNPTTGEQNKTKYYTDKKKFKESQNHWTSSTEIKSDGTIQTNMTYNIFLNPENKNSLN